MVRYATQGELVPEAIHNRCAEARLAEVPRFELELKVLKGMVAAAPLLGLLGTVRGMVATFSILAAKGTSSIALLSAGISEALVTTQLGLVVALPGIAAIYAISRRLAGLEVALDIVESHLAATASRTREEGGAS
jgi:biopolymer transport protein ExbB